MFGFLVHVTNGQVCDSFSKYLMDEQNNAVFPSNGINTSKPVSKFIFDTQNTKNGEMIAGGVVVGPNGMLYFTQGMWLYAISSDGELVWKHKSSGYFDDATPLVDQDGTVYAIGTKGEYNEAPFVVALSVTGEKKWNYNIPAGIYHTPLSMGGNGNIYFQSGGRFLHSLDPDGTPNWKLDAAPHYVLEGSLEKLSVSPAIAKDGTMVMTTADGVIHAITTEGKELWKYSVEGPFYSFKSPVMDEEGDIYISVDGGNGYDYNASVLCLSIDGSLKWELDLDDAFDDHDIRNLYPPVIYEGFVYIASDYYLFCVKDGKPVWSYYNLDPAYGSLTLWGTPLIAANNKMLHFGAMFYVYGFSLTDPTTPISSPVMKKQLHTYGSNGFTPSLDENGVLYAAAYQRVYAFTNE